VNLMQTTSQWRCTSQHKPPHEPPAVCRYPQALNAFALHDVNRRGGRCQATEE
jgi:hypothetical protein